MATARVQPAEAFQRPLDCLTPHRLLRKIPDSHHSITAPGPPQTLQIPRHKRNFGPPRTQQPTKRRANSRGGTRDQHSFVD